MKRSKALILVAVLLIFAVLALFAAEEVQKRMYPREFVEYVEKYAGLYEVPEALVYSVILAESGFDPNAKSHAGAYGLMQLVPDTLDWLSRLLDEEAPTGEITDPETNIKYGTYYLRHLYNRFGCWDTALAAYNAGHGRVGNWLKDSRYSDDGVNLKEIPIDETRNYVNKINKFLKQYEKLYYNEEE
ncbi:MAG: lytic transglycosylase domain-containing protein [Clostridia bacterium]|nr:lytic transglycosylase domain-containing protein [Clostridia bacterium]